MRTNMASCSEEGLTAAPPQRVFDSHIHLAVDWREGEGGLPNEWLPNQPTAFHRNWTEADMLALSEESGGAFQVVGAVYVECFNRPALEEARWALRMADDPSSVVEAHKICGISRVQLDSSSKAKHLSVPDVMRQQVGMRGGITDEAQVCSCITKPGNCAFMQQHFQRNVVGTPAAIVEE